MLQDNKNIEKVPYAFESVILKHPKEVEGLISIIIPIYNVKLYLKEALDSVMTQTFENWEAILVNDCSTDESSEICLEYAKKDSRFKYIYKEHNEGQLFARKTGLENTNGEFIAHLDADDAYHPQFLEKMFIKINENNNDFVYCNFEDLNGKEKFLYGKHIETREYQLSENKLENCLYFSSFGHAFLWNKLIRRSIFIKNLYPQINLTLNEDTVLSLQIIYHSKHAEFIPDSLYLLRIASATSSSRTLNVSSEDKRRASRILSMITSYSLMKQFFGADDAELFFANELIHFSDCFFLSDKSIAYHKIEYAKNFIPAFSRGLSKSKTKKIRWAVLTLACKGFPQPFRILSKIKKIIDKILTWKKIYFFKEF